MLRFKPEVRIVFGTSRLSDVLSAACDWSLFTRITVRVNSIDDPAPDRVPDTLHGWSLAVDFGVDSDFIADRLALANYLRKALPAGYDVILESDHVHVEYDMRRAPFPV